MGGIADLNIMSDHIDTGYESVLIRRKGGRIIGGRTLNLVDFTGDQVKAGHIIIRSTTDDTDFRPAPVTDGKYSTIATGFEYAGVLVRTVTKKDPRAAIQYDGEINDKALPYPIDNIKAALKTALPSLYFMHD